MEHVVRHKLLGRLPAGRQEFSPRYERILTKSVNVYRGRDF